MEQLDNNKIPKLGTSGEKYRDLQLVIQLPKQDLSETHCKQLETAGQEKAFQDFIATRENNSIGIGTVREFVKESTVSCSQSICD